VHNTIFTIGVSGHDNKVIIMKRRCEFELQFCELSGIPSTFESIRVVIDHRDGKRRYAATEPVKLSFGTATVPKISFQCGLYPAKVPQQLQVTPCQQHSCYRYACI
jgi:hypothetical protein